MSLPSRNLLALAGVLLALAGPAFAQQAPQAPSLTERVDRAIDQALADHRIVGAVVLVAQDGKIVYHRAAGLADRESKKPMREDAIFRLASMTKPIVTVAALKLVEQGKLRLDDPVTKWLPDFRPKLADGREPVITVRKLLTHTAGLSYGFLEPDSGPYHRAHVSDGLDESDVSLEENLRRIASVPLSYEPGTQWGYSVAIDVLGAVVAKAGGAPLPRVVEQLVTAPLGMKDTHFSANAKDAERLATPYADGKPEPVRMGDPYTVIFHGGGVRYSPSRALNPRAFPSGGGGMVGTAGDFLKFLETLRTGGGPVLTAKTAAQVGTNQTGTIPTLRGPGWGFGFGAAVVLDPAQAHTPQSAGTLEWGGAYGSSWFMDPQKRTAVVVLTNTALEGMSGAFPTAVRDAVYGR